MKKLLRRRFLFSFAFLFLFPMVCLGTVVNIYDNQTITSGVYDEIHTWNNANLTFTGDAIDDYLWLHNNSFVNLNGGSAKDFLDIILFDSATLNISNFQPDSVSYIRLGASETSFINFYVLSYSISNSIVSGYWGNGIYFSDFHIRDVSTISRINFYIVPEPISCVLLGLGCLLIKRN